jgi:hypothetical protein
MKRGRTGNKERSYSSDEDEVYPDYPAYPPEEDIYDKYQEEDLDPDKLTDVHRTRKRPHTDEDEDELDLDIPGSELDNFQENIGSEDEENNYYSLGGDNHNDLDEDQG